MQRRLLERLGLGVPRVPVKTAGDRFAEFFLLLAMLSATLGKIAQNVYNLQVTDVDEVTEFVEGKVGSTAMPHKLNPVASGSVVLLGRLLRARAPLMLEYVHAEWEDDHRQGGDLVGVPAGGLPAARGPARDQPPPADEPGREARGTCCATSTAPGASCSPRR